MKATDTHEASDESPGMTTILSKDDVSNTITFNEDDLIYDGTTKSLTATTTDTTDGTFTYSYVGVGGTDYPEDTIPPT